MDDVIKIAPNGQWKLLEKSYDPKQDNERLKILQAYIDKENEKAVARGKPAQKYPEGMKPVESTPAVADKRTDSRALGEVSPQRLGRYIADYGGAPKRFVSEASDEQNAANRAAAAQEEASQEPKVISRTAYDLPGTPKTKEYKSTPNAKIVAAKQPDSAAGADVDTRLKNLHWLLTLPQNSSGNNRQDVLNEIDKRIAELKLSPVEAERQKAVATAMARSQGTTMVSEPVSQRAGGTELPLTSDTEKQIAGLVAKQKKLAAAAQQIRRMSGETSPTYRALVDEHNKLQAQVNDLAAKTPSRISMPSASTPGKEAAPATPAAAPSGIQRRADLDNMVTREQLAPQRPGGYHGESQRTFGKWVKHPETGRDAREWYDWRWDKNKKEGSGGWDSFGRGWQDHDDYEPQIDRSSEQLKRPKAGDTRAVDRTPTEAGRMGLAQPGSLTGARNEAQGTTEKDIANAKTQDEQVSKLIEQNRAAAMSNRVDMSKYCPQCGSEAAEQKNAAGESFKSCPRCGPRPFTSSATAPTGGLLGTYAKTPGAPAQPKAPAAPKMSSYVSPDDDEE